ncbi:uncharacterized protein LOC119332979 [Triticum dicoccoides]|uniref:uncharacterized protein LOC119332979 n=1 Tax=Triticum dicoccoides TaxID=85692 RepID=UPI0018917AE7|nr:uncharacterized protein LOC119332979 [Triticum dicoccoides]
MGQGSDTQSVTTTKLMDYYLNTPFPVPTLIFLSMACGIAYEFSLQERHSYSSLRFAIFGNQVNYPPHRILRLAELQNNDLMPMDGYVYIPSLVVQESGFSLSQYFYLCYKLICKAD